MNKTQQKKKYTGSVWIFDSPDGDFIKKLIENVSQELKNHNFKVFIVSFEKPISDCNVNSQESTFHTSMQKNLATPHVWIMQEEILPAIKSGISVFLNFNIWRNCEHGILTSTLKEAKRKERTFLRKLPIKKIFLINSLESLLAESEDILLEKERWLCENYFSVRDVGDIEYFSCSSDMAEQLSGSIAEQIITKEANFKGKLNIISHAILPKPTEVYDAYWSFAAKRQDIFYERLHNAPFPWSDDPVLQEFKFTNAYRASDRTSQYLIRNIIYEKNASQSAEEVFFRILIFKIFNKISTWEVLKRNLGEVTYADYNFEKYDSILKNEIDSGERIYSAAYIMPSGMSSFGYQYKHQNNLMLISSMLKDNVPSKITECKTMNEVFELLLSYPTIGSFLAYQFATDINYSNMTDFDEMSFVVPGPGALNGLRKCFSSFGDLSEADIIKSVAGKQEDEFIQRNIKFKDLCGRKLQLIDCQNLFCEIDKYARVAFPCFNKEGTRSRIKQKFQVNTSPIEYWYPPKWGINEKMNQVQHNAEVTNEYL